MFSGGTHHGTIHQSYGGVGRNLADALSRLQCNPLLVSAVGQDSHAHALTAHSPLLDQRGLVVVKEASTAVYCVVLDHRGEALFGIGDMSVHDHITPHHVRQFEEEISRAPLVVVDGNLPQPTINYVLDLCGSCSVPVWYEPTDIQKAVKPWLGGRGDKVAFASPNLNELLAVCSHLGLGELGIAPERSENLHELLEQIFTTATPLLQTMHALLVTLGPHGFMILRHTSPDGIDSPLLPVGASVDTDAAAVKHDVVGLHFPGPVNPQIVSVSGAGDCLAAGFITGMLNGKSISECCALGLSAATLSLAASPAVPNTLSPQALPWDHPETFTIIA